MTFFEGHTLDESGCNSHQSRIYYRSGCKISVRSVEWVTLKKGHHLSKRKNPNIRKHLLLGFLRKFWVWAAKVRNVFTKNCSKVSSEVHRIPKIQGVIVNAHWKEGRISFLSVCT